MNSFIGLSGTLTALILFSSFGTAPALAQSQNSNSSDDVPTLRQDSIPVQPAASKKPAVTPNVVLMPIAPPAHLVASAAAPVGGLAQVIPPAPRLVAAASGAIVIPAGGFG